MRAVLCSFPRKTSLDPSQSLLLHNQVLRSSFCSSQSQIDANKNYYSVLGLNERASKKEIREAYLKAVKQWHPDVHKGSVEKQWANAKFIEAQDAYKLLNDDTSRREYDERRASLSQMRFSGRRATRQTEENEQFDYHRDRGDFSRSFGGWQFREHFEEMRRTEWEEMRNV